MTGPAARRIAADGVELAAYQWGASTAPPVVLVHGYPDTSAVWRPVAERLADRFHVTAFDVRGAGASHRPRGLRAYRMSRLEADLEAVLDAVSPDRPVHLVGHDWGSIHSWESVTGTRLAGRIASFTSISGPCLDHVGHLIRARLRPRHPDLPKMLRQAARSWYIAYFHLPLLPALTWRALGHRWRTFLTGSQGMPGHTPTPRRRWPATPCPAPRCTAPTCCPACCVPGTGRPPSRFNSSSPPATSASPRCCRTEWSTGRARYNGARSTPGTGYSSATPRRSRPGSRNSPTASKTAPAPLRTTPRTRSDSPTDQQYWTTA